MWTKISNFLKDLLHRSPLAASTPYVPHPPEQPSGDPTADANRFYEETSTDIETIAGTEIHFGKAKTTTVDQNGNTIRTRRRVGYILGDGKLVTSLESRIEDGLYRPGVDGLCRPCLAEAILEFEAGLISHEELQRRALFSTLSAAQCEGCGRTDICARHCRPLARLDGTQPRLCPACAEAATREDRDRQSFYMLVSPFLERKRLPPPHDQEKSS
jgi:hypothetical protein